MKNLRLTLVLLTSLLFPSLWVSFANAQVSSELPVPLLAIEVLSWEIYENGDPIVDALPGTEVKPFIMCSTETLTAESNFSPQDAPYFSVVNDGELDMDVFSLFIMPLDSETSKLDCVIYALDEDMPQVTMESLSKLTGVPAATLTLFNLFPNGQKLLALLVLLINQDDLLGEHRFTLSAENNWGEGFHEHTPPDGSFKITYRVRKGKLMFEDYSQDVNSTQSTEPVGSDTPTGNNVSEEIPDVTECLPKIVDLKLRMRESSADPGLLYHLDFIFQCADEVKLFDNIIDLHNPTFPVYNEEYTFFTVQVRKGDKCDIESYDVWQNNDGSYSIALSQAPGNPNDQPFQCKF